MQTQHKIQRAPQKSTICERPGCGERLEYGHMELRGKRACFDRDCVEWLKEQAERVRV